MRTALVLGVFSPFLVAPEVPAFAVEVGTKVTKTFTNRMHLELVEFGMTQNDEDVDLGGEMPTFVVDDEEEIVIVDEYFAVEGGRPTKIVRTFETLTDTSSTSGDTPDGESSEETREGTSTLEGKSVRFAWDSDEEAYTVTWAKDEDAGSAEDLEDLEGDADYIFLLPSGDVEVGDSWELEGEAFNRISAPGGDLKIDAPEDDPDSDFPDQFKDNIDGTLTCTLKSIEEGVATITLEGEFTTMVEGDDVPEGAPAGVEITMTYSFTFEGEGELLWDMEAGRASSFQFGGEVNLEIVNTQKFQENSLVVMQVLEGEFSSKAEF